jgi:DNA-binding NtrC family response regulator
MSAFMPNLSEPTTFLGTPAVIASEPMRELMRMVERVGQTSASVLIQGESGSGKELIARALHHYSRRCAKPWIDISCAALPEQLVESELFGYERGAFSGAQGTKAGLFELAHEGTLFLDEIGELDIRMQAKLLRVLDGVPYYRLGGVRKISVDVRIIAATNINLENAAKKGLFRNDLLHRLAQIPISVPPLRERVDDIVPLAKYFLAEHRGMTLSGDAQALLRTHTWPGNVRELRNVITKAAIIAQGTEITASDIPIQVPVGTPDTVAGDLLQLVEVERRMIYQVLAQTNGHQQRAAELLGISRRTLSRKLKSYGAREESEPSYA